MGATGVWLVLGFMLLVAEMVTGTFYLLMIAFGCAVGALAALAVGLEWQILCAAVCGTLAVITLRQSRFGRRQRTMLPEANPDLVIDVGQTVEVHAWQDGRARVEYRGAQWDAIPEDPGGIWTGALAIKAIRGSTLVLGPASSTH